ncbi:hypothetical protein N9L68_01775 [bacterium]|nr:hypothetical protein [bacterium]
MARWYAAVPRRRAYVISGGAACTAACIPWKQMGSVSQWGVPFVVEPSLEEPVLEAALAKGLGECFDGSKCLRSPSCAGGLSRCDE